MGGWLDEWIEASRVESSTEELIISCCVPEMNKKGRKGMEGKVGRSVLLLLLAGWLAGWVVG